MLRAVGCSSTPDLSSLVSRSRPLTAICSDIVEDALSSIISDLSSMMFAESYQPQSLLLYQMRRCPRSYAELDLGVPTVYSEDQNASPTDVQFGPLSWVVRPMKENGFSFEKEQQGGVFPTAACFRPRDALDSSLALCLRNHKVTSNFDDFEFRISRLIFLDYGIPDICVFFMLIDRARSRSSASMQMSAIRSYLRLKMMTNEFPRHEFHS